MPLSKSEIVAALNKTMQTELRADEDAPLPKPRELCRILFAFGHDSGLAWADLPRGPRRRAPTTRKAPGSLASTRSPRDNLLLVNE